MLTGDEIKVAGLIGDANPIGFRAARYDVTIGTIVTATGATADSHALSPQGIVQVVSRERISLPRDISGAATVKTSLCNEGVLALSIGIIDPGYDGPVSSFLVNFGNASRFLTAGESFLRLEFVRPDAPVSTSAPARVDAAAYLAERRRQATRTGATFLNIDAVVEDTTKKTFDAWRGRIFVNVGGFAVVLAVLTFLMNSGTQTFKGWLAPSDTERADLLRRALLDDNARLATANEELAARVAALEAASRAARPAVPSASIPGARP